MTRVKTVVRTHLKLSEDDIDRVARTNEENIRSDTVKGLVLRCRVWAERRDAIRHLISEDLEAVFLEEAILIICKRQDSGPAAKIVRNGDSWYVSLMEDIAYTAEAFDKRNLVLYRRGPLGHPLYKRYGPIASQRSACKHASDVLVGQGIVDYDWEVE